MQSNSLRSRHNAPSPNDVVSITGEQSLAIRTPCQTDTLRLSTLLADCLEFWLQLINLTLLLQIKDNDAAGSSSAEPVAVRREDKGVDLITSVQRVEVLGLVQIPQHCGSILAARSAERSVGGDSNGVDVASMSDVVGLQPARRKLPDLKSLVSPISSLLFSIQFRACEDRFQCIGVGLSHGLISSSEVANTV
jgi:hypothetical protein